MSRKIDALVAEHVMGLPKKDVKANWVKTHDFAAWGNVPNYSMSIAAAWEVWNWFKDRGAMLELDWDTIECRATCVIRWSDNDGEFLVEISAKTEEMAICLAALKAKGVDVAE